MALIVETGSGSATAESYETVDNAGTYTAARGLTFNVTGAPAIALAEQALRRATMWIDSSFRSRFTGYRRYGRDQALEWPRTGAYDNMIPPNTIEENEIPVELKYATIEAAVRELAIPGSLSPDVTLGKIKRSVSVGQVSVTYAVGGSIHDQRPTIIVIGGILAPLLIPANGMFASSVRGG